MTRKKGNMCTKCGVRHGAPTGKKCAHVKDTENSTANPQLGSVSNGIQASPSEVPKAVDADHLAPAVEVEERMDVVERSVTQMKSMMAQVLMAVGVKETDQELTESQVEGSSEDDGFEQVRSRKKKKSKRTHKKKSRCTRSMSASSVTSASDSEEGNTKQYAQKRFLAKDVKANSTAAKGCFWEMTPTGSITRYHLFFLIEDSLGYVKSVVVEKLIWSRI